MATATRDRVRFLLGGAERALAAPDPSMTVLEYLRRVERRCGTKEGCAEGDCGACTVVLGELEGDGVRYRPVNACIQFLPTIDGKQLITIEDLAGPDGALHPAQQAMVETSGSQCGFCTPGVVMSLFAMFHGGAAPDRDGIDDALAGNLCRCTGYGPIAAAAERMFELAPFDPFDAQQRWAAERLKRLHPGSLATVTPEGRRFLAPADLETLTALCREHPDAWLLAGGTDVGLWVTKQHRRPETVIYLGNVAELQRIETSDGWLEIGAMATYERLQPILAAHWPDFGELLRRLGSTQIRAVGTMGGNVANGSPIGDSPPALIALGARLVLNGGGERREMPLEDFFVAYGRQDRRPGEIVETIRLPLPRPGWHFACYKVSKRFDQDITAVLGAFHLRLEQGRVAEARICFGGMAATPKRAPAAEAALTGRPWSRETVALAQRALAEDYQPIDDMRASRSYRARIAENLLLKLFVESTGAGVETRLPGTRRRAAHG
jgi:xanthine dehydrogenase small subunit